MIFSIFDKTDFTIFPEPDVMTISVRFCLFYV